MFSWIRSVPTNSCPVGSFCCQGDVTFFNKIRHLKSSESTLKRLSAMNGSLIVRYCDWRRVPFSSWIKLGCLYFNSHPKRRWASWNVVVGMQNVTQTPNNPAFCACHYHIDIVSICGRWKTRTLMLLIWPVVAEFVPTEFRILIKMDIVCWRFAFELGNKLSCWIQDVFKIWICVQTWKTKWQAVFTEGGGPDQLCKAKGGASVMRRAGSAAPLLVLTERFITIILTLSLTETAVLPKSALASLFRINRCKEQITQIKEDLEVKNWARSPSFFYSSADLLLNCSITLLAERALVTDSCRWMLWQRLVGQGTNVDYALFRPHQLVSDSSFPRQGASVLSTAAKCWTFMKLYSFADLSHQSIFEYLTWTVRRWSCLNPAFAGPLPISGMFSQL